MAKGLSKPVIVDAGLRVLDRVGIDGLTVRALAAELGVKAPALYWHVKDKQQLLDEMGTEIQRRVMDTLVARERSADWVDNLRTYATVLRSTYLRHRDGARTFSGTLLTDPGILAAQEPWLESFVALGLALRDAMDAGEAVTAFVVGFVIEEQERSQSAPERYAVVRRDAALGDSSPLVASGPRISGTTDERFSRQLELLLTGLRVGIDPSTCANRESR